jgi:peptidyl-prolyl cis-trans isomerase SurA
MVRKILFIAAFVSTSILGFSQPLFSYGKKQVTKAEFLKAYNKNPSLEETDIKKALQEYLQLYINYKLKVQSAYDDKLNEQETFKYESINFKKQIAENIINNEANINELVKEAFDRSQKDIEVAQVFVELKPGVDNIEATNQIQKAYALLKEGKDFAEIATTYSNDESTKQAKGNLGFITAFTLPYEFENEIYKLKKGEFSAPYKSSFGYHIFKILNERPAAGKRKVAQVLITVPKDATDDAKQKFIATADTVYNRAMRGIAFEQLVAEFSTDRATMGNSGIMNEIAVGQLDPYFEQQAYALTTVGSIGKPFMTQFGWHILKLIETTPVGKDFNDPVTAALIKQQVERADRLTIAKKALVKKWMKLCNYKPGIFDEKEFLIFTDSAAKDASLTSFKKVTPATVLFSFTKQKVTGADWAKFVTAIKQSGSPLSLKSTPDLLKEYEQIVCAEYYQEHLEDFNESLKEQSKEFDEANLLFGAMDKNVWAKAGEDTTGLKNYYTKHASKYTWAAGISAIVFTTTNEATANQVIDSLKNNFVSWRQWMVNFSNNVITDSSRFENNQLPINQTIENKVGYISKPEKSNSDDSYTFIYVTAIHNDTAIRSFEDARGLVTNDYQQVLEQQWIIELKKKYPIKINDTVWKTVK